MGSNRLYPIPQPDTKPVVGNMFSVDASRPLQSMMDLTREMGPIFWMDMMGTPMVIVSGVDLTAELCDEKRFDKTVRGALKRIRVIGGDGLFTGDTDAPNWQKAHNILLPTFAHRAMVNYLPMMQDIASQLMLKWERLNADDEIDVVHDMTALALDTIGVCGFGYRFNSFYRQDYHPFIDALNRTLETCMMQKGLPFEDNFLRGRLKQLEKDSAYMNRLVDEIIAERKKGSAGNTEEQTNDLLNYMLQGVDKATGESLSDENIRYQINTFLIAGHETTSGLMSFTLYYLLNHPDVLAKAYEEVDRVLGKDISATPTFQQINQLTYIQQILYEALRLWPTAPAFSLEPYEDEMIGGKYPIKKRTFTTVLSLMLHRDKTVWGEDAEAFNPDNFTREAVAARPAHAYKPFGNGQRACIGRQFAMQEATLVMGLMLQRFQLIDHTNYQLKIKESLSIKPDGFTIKVKPRPGRTRSVLVPGAKLDSGKPETKVTSGKRPSHGTPLTVLYGSNLGSTEEFARDIAQSGELNGFDVTLAPMDDYVAQLPKDGAVIVATASYNGSPPDNAVQFVSWLEDASPGALEGVKYAVFGCGNRDWASTFQHIPRYVDARMEELGASRITSRGESDAREDLEGQFQAWFEGLFPAVGKALDLALDFEDKVEAEPLYDLAIVDKPASASLAGQLGCVPMEVLANYELQNEIGNVSGRSTRHIEVALPEGTNYRPGDHLCVVPENPGVLIERVIKRFDLDPDSWLELTPTGGRQSALPSGKPIALKTLLKEYVELQAVASRSHIKKMLAHTRCPKTQKELEALAADKPDTYRKDVFLKRRSVLDLLEDHPACEMPFSVFLELLPSMAPRYYSISSAPSAEPSLCSITVAVVEGQARSGHGIFRGVCSNHLKGSYVGAHVNASLRDTKTGFRLPEDATRPIIMVGPGTGLAPFRGFLQERASLKKKRKKLGPAMLFFGCRHPDQDFIYEDELKSYDKRGLCELHVAFSRLKDEKQYVQDVIREQQKRVWELIEAGAKIFICGDGSHMEPDVKRALIRIYAENKDVDIGTAEMWMEQMIEDDNYVLDVWAGS